MKKVRTPGNGWRRPTRTRHLQFRVPETGDSVAPVKKNAKVLRKLLVVRLGEGSSDPEATTVVAENACSYSVRYEL